MSDIGVAEIPVDEDERPLPPPATPAKNALLDGPILRTLERYRSRFAWEPWVEEEDESSVTALPPGSATAAQAGRETQIGRDWGVGGEASDASGVFTHPVERERSLP